MDPHPVPPSGDCTLEELPVIKPFGLVHLPAQLHSVLFGQGGALLPLPAPKSRLVKALPLIIFKKVTFDMFFNTKCEQSPIIRTERVKSVSALSGQVGAYVTSA